MRLRFLNVKKNDPSDQSEMTQDQSLPQGAHVWFAKVNFIAVECQFHVSDGVCDYCVLFCRNVIQ